MLYNYHIFFALLSCRRKYMKTYMIQFPALELSLAGLNFHSQVFVSHWYRLQFSSVLYYKFFYFCMSRLVHLKFCMCYLFLERLVHLKFCMVFFFRSCVKSSNIVKGIVFSPSSVTKYSCSIKFLDD